MGRTINAKNRLGMIGELKFRTKVLELSMDSDLVENVSAVDYQGQGVDSYVHRSDRKEIRVQVKAKTSEASIAGVSRYYNDGVDFIALYVHKTDTWFIVPVEAAYKCRSDSDGFSITMRKPLGQNCHENWSFFLRKRAFSKKDISRLIHKTWP